MQLYYNKSSKIHRFFVIHVEPITKNSEYTNQFYGLRKCLSFHAPFTFRGNAKWPGPRWSPPEKSGL